ncbi:MAG: hypothetical protein BWY70_01900 [Bacteroidetes bacterium ADurb.Bin408]|nr:MAG: hypothetical protein BWY70_01900 [Bacteroidetes bacterium ADurb.Bin408]
MQDDKMDALLTLSGYPNPFGNTVNLIYTLPENGTVKINVYNSLGELVRKIADGEEMSGKHILEIPTAQLPHGLYTFKMEFSGDKVSDCRLMKMIH